MTTIYLDHNATTPIAAEAVAAMVDCYARHGANPESQHALGRAARHTLEDAREGVAALLGVDLASRTPDQLIFTSGGTEANHLALFGAWESDDPHAAQRSLVVSAIEHPSVLVAAEELARRGARLRLAPVDAQGVIDVAALIDSVVPGTRLVSVMLANNETGVLQPIGRIAEACAARGAALHTDAAQVVGKLPVDFHGLGASLLSCAAHKFHGPPGIGALAIRHDVKLQPQMWGGFQQSGLRPGTESVALAVGMRRALEVCLAEMDSRAERMRRLRDRFESRLSRGYPALVVQGASVARLPHASNVAFVGLDRQALFMALDVAGIAASTGSACASGSSEPSPVLVAMGRPKAEIDSALRFSLGAGTTEAEIDDAVGRILMVCARMTAGHTASAPPTIQR